MTAGEPQSNAVTGPEAVASARSVARYHWYQKALAIGFATLCLEMGCFLVLFPWTRWAEDFAAFQPVWAPYWDNPYARVAISGLGVVNLVISFIEIHRLRRFARR